MKRLNIFESEEEKPIKYIMFITEYTRNPTILALIIDLKPKWLKYPLN
jgi:hypothetical protein